MVNPVYSTGMEPRASFSHDGLFFRPPRKEDLEAIQHLRNDESTWVHLSDPRLLGPADQKAWIETVGWRSGKMFLVVFDKEHPFVGLVRLDAHDPQNRSIRVGLDVAVELRGRGYGKRVYAALKRYAFDYLNVHRLWLNVLDTNERAKKLYEKCGFKLEGCYREAIFRGGKYVDYLIMSILEGEYRGGV